MIMQDRCKFGGACQNCSFSFKLIEINVLRESSTSEFCTAWTHSDIAGHGKWGLV